MLPIKSPASTTATHRLTSTDPPVNGAGVPVKVYLCPAVLLCILVPLPVGVAVPLTLAAVEDVVKLMCVYRPTWAHKLTAYALVTVIAAISKHFAKTEH